MKRIFSIVLLLFLLVGFGTVFVNLCFTPTTNSCHNSNPYDDCHYKPTPMGETSKDEIVTPFSFISSIDLSTSKLIDANKFSDNLFVERQFLEYSSFIKFLHPSNAPPQA